MFMWCFSHRLYDVIGVDDFSAVIVSAVDNHRCRHGNSGSHAVVDWPVFTLGLSRWIGAVNFISLVNGAYLKFIVAMVFFCFTVVRFAALAFKTLSIVVFADFLHEISVFTFNIGLYLNPKRIICRSVCVSWDIAMKYIGLTSVL